MAKQALLLMDVQRHIVNQLPAPEIYLSRAESALAAARAADVPVIHVHVVFRPGHPEIRTGDKAFAPFRGTDHLVMDNPDSLAHPAVAPLPGELVVTKRMISAFTGSDLDLLLRSQDIDTLVLAGISTSGAVLSTVRAAGDLQYRQVVLSDGCVDLDTTVHTVLLERVFPMHADVMTVRAWQESL
ncbi:isochorismatase family cysteine hydrolase [Streptomyces sp. NPDC002054]|uniref:cysteine hydrolase family protein n=1 Tax=Streptomyces sp. NPDC002054 TaxID=3154663 RepID=UPI00332BCDEA